MLGIKTTISVRAEKSRLSIFINQDPVKNTETAGLGDSDSSLRIPRMYTYGIKPGTMALV